MKLLGMGPAPLMLLRIPRGSPYNPTFRYQTEAGEDIDVTGRKFSFIFYNNRGDTFLTKEATGEDSTISFQIDGEDTETFGFEQKLYWELAEVFTNGKAQILTGGLIIAPAANNLLTSGEVDSSSEEIVFNPSKGETVIVPIGRAGPQGEQGDQGDPGAKGDQGNPGYNAAQVLANAGIIPDATPTSFNNYLNELAVNAVSATEVIDLVTALLNNSKPLPRVAPTVTGDPVEGGTLTASGGTFYGTVISSSWQWYRDGVAISGATASTYTLLPADRQALVQVGKIATNLNGSSNANMSTNQGKTLLALPMASGAKVMGLGHSFIVNGATQAGFSLASYPASNGHAGGTTNARGIINWVRYLDDRFNVDVLPTVSDDLLPPSSFLAWGGAMLCRGGLLFEPHADSGGAIRPNLRERIPQLRIRKPHITYIDCGINDVSLNLTSAQIIQDFNGIVNDVIAAGSYALLQTISDTSQITPVAGDTTEILASKLVLRQVVYDINNWIKAQAGRFGVRVIDSTAVDGPDSNIASRTPTRFYDSYLHPNNLFMADANSRVDILLATLRNMVSPGAWRTNEPIVGNLFPLLGMGGKNGAKTARATGDVATGMNVQPNSGSSTYVASKEIISQAAVFTASMTTANVMTVTAVAAGTLAVGQTITGSAATGNNPQPATKIVSQTSGTAGGVGVYQVLSPAGNQLAVASMTMYADSLEKTVLQITPVADGVANHLCLIRPSLATLALFSNIPQITSGMTLRSTCYVEISDTDTFDFIDQATGRAPVQMDVVMGSSTVNFMTGADSVGGRNRSGRLTTLTKFWPGMAADRIRLNNGFIRILSNGNATQVGTIKIHPMRWDIVDPYAAWNY